MEALLQQLQAAEAKVEEEQQLREEEERPRKTAEAKVKESQPQTLLRYLNKCQESFHDVTVVTDKTSTTQGDTTDPTDRPYPLRIVPWDDFLNEQANLGGPLSNQSDFYSQKSFPLSLLKHVHSRSVR